MSTIMKALRRLESDKNSRVQRSLREEVVGGHETRRRSPILLVGAAVFATGLALGAGGLLFWPDKVPLDTDTAPAEVARPTPGARPTPPVADRAAASPAPEAAKRGAASRRRRREAVDRNRARQAAPPSVTRAAADPPVGAPEPEVAVVRRIEPPPLDMPEEPEDAAPRQASAGNVRPGAEALKPTPRPSPPPGPPQTTRVAQVAEAATPQPRTQPVAQPPVPPPVAPEPARVAERPEPARVTEPPEAAPEPALSDSAPASVPDSRISEPMPARSTVPVILVSSTHWHPSAERREALIEVEDGEGPEKRRVREGDSVGPLRVEKIEPSGVVFDYAGTELRHAVSSDTD